MRTTTPPGHYRHRLKQRLRTAADHLRSTLSGALRAPPMEETTAYQLGFEAGLAHCQSMSAATEISGAELWNLAWEACEMSHAGDLPPNWVSKAAARAAAEEATMRAQVRPDPGAGDDGCRRGHPSSAVPEHHRRTSAFEDTFEDYHVVITPVPVEVAAAVPPPPFTCPGCAATEHPPANAGDGYCGHCHRWACDVPPTPETARVSSPFEEFATPPEGRAEDA